MRKCVLLNIIQTKYYSTYLTFGSCDGWKGWLRDQLCSINVTFQDGG